MSGPLWILTVIAAFVFGWRCGLCWERALNYVYVEFLSGLLREKDDIQQAYLERGPILQERCDGSHTLH